MASPIKWEGWTGGYVSFLFFGDDTVFTQSCFNSRTFWWFWCGQRSPSNEAFGFVLFVLSKVRNWLHPSLSNTEKRTVSLSGKLNQCLGTESMNKSWTVPFPHSFSFLNRGLIQSINLEKGKDPIRINWTETEESTQVIAFWLEIRSWKGEMWLERCIKACHQRRDTEYVSFGVTTLVSSQVWGLSSQPTTSGQVSFQLQLRIPPPYLRQHGDLQPEMARRTFLFIFRWTDLKGLVLPLKGSFAFIPNILICALVCDF